MNTILYTKYDTAIEFDPWQALPVPHDILFLTLSEVLSGNDSS